MYGAPIESINEEFFNNSPQSIIFKSSSFLKEIEENPYCGYYDNKNGIGYFYTKEKPERYYRMRIFKEIHIPVGSKSGWKDMDCTVIDDIDPNLVSDLKPYENDFVRLKVSEEKWKTNVTEDFNSQSISIADMKERTIISILGANSNSVTVETIMTDIIKAFTQRGSEYTNVVASKIHNGNLTDSYSAKICDITMNNFGIPSKCKLYGLYTKDKKPIVITEILRQASECKQDEIYKSIEIK